MKLMCFILNMYPFVDNIDLFISQYILYKNKEPKYVYLVLS